MPTSSVTQLRYPGAFGAPFSTFSLDAPHDWTRVWFPGTLGALDATDAAGIPASAFRPNLAVEASRVGGGVTLEQLAREVLDGESGQTPKLVLIDEVVTEVNGRPAIRRTQEIYVTEIDLTVRQVHLMILTALPHVDEQEFFRVTASFDASQVADIGPAFDDVLASFQFDPRADA